MVIEPNDNVNPPIPSTRIVEMIIMLRILSKSMSLNIFKPEEAIKPYIDTPTTKARGILEKFDRLRDPYSQRACQQPST